MLGRNGNIAYVRYDHQGRIVAGGPIISAKPPKVGNWQAVSNVIGTNWTGSSGTNVLRAFVRIDYFNRVVPSSLVLLTKEPGDNNSQTTWLEINAQYRGNGITTTTTTTLPPISTTTSTTTAVPTTSTTTTQAVYSFYTNLIPNYTSGCIACTNYPNGPFVTFYSNVSTLTLGSVLYNDPALTSPYSGVNDGWFATDNNGVISSIRIAASTGVIFENPQPCTECTTTTTTTIAPTTTTTTTIYFPPPGNTGIDGYLHYETDGISTPFKIKYSLDGVSWYSIFSSYVGGYPNGNLYAPIAAGFVGYNTYIAVTDMSDNDINFGIGDQGPYYTYCGISNPYVYTVLPPSPPYSQTIHVNVAASAGQLVQC